MRLAPFALDPVQIEDGGELSSRDGSEEGHRVRVMLDSGVLEGRRRRLVGGKIAVTFVGLGC